MRICGRSALCRTFAGLFLSLALSVPAFAAEGPADALWRDLPEGSSERAVATEAGVPVEGRLLELDLPRLETLLATAPFASWAAESSGLARTSREEVFVSLPLPEGGFERFRVEESPIAAGSSPSTGSELKTYRGVGVDDPDAVARFSVSSAGLYALLLQGGRGVFVGPAREGDAVLHASTRVTGGNFLCGTQGAAGEGERVIQKRELTGAQSPGNVRYSYRLALAGSVGFVRRQCANSTDRQACVEQAGLFRRNLVNLVNLILTTELSVSLELIDDRDVLLFACAKGDTDCTNPNPYTSESVEDLKNQNQIAIDRLIGTANYDIGHVLVDFQPPATATAGGGVVAGKGEINGFCDPDKKALGATAVEGNSPTTLINAVFAMAHELGHQLGAHHTFVCGGGVDALDAYEPGTGSTLMAYGNNPCGDKPGLGVNPYYHIDSLDWIFDSIAKNAKKKDCGKSFDLSTAAFTLTPAAPLKATIPQNTPFLLVAEVAGRTPDMTFTWEELDALLPSFRSVPPNPSPVRVLPALASLLLAQPHPGEDYPSGGRAMTFRLTARNQKGGMANAGSATVIVDAHSGPFKVYRPAESSTWESGREETVSWGIENQTAVSPIRCETVTINLLASDGRFLANLGTGTGISGSLKVVAPELTVNLFKQAHVVVGCNGNIFFAVSPGFSIVPKGKVENTPPVASFTASPERAIAAVIKQRKGSDLLPVKLDPSGSFDLDGELNRADSFTWDFGDGSPPVYEKSPVHTYFIDFRNTPDVVEKKFTVTLTVTDSNQAVAKATKEVTAINARFYSRDADPFARKLFRPKAVIQAAASGVRAPVTVRFDGSGSYHQDRYRKIVRYLWEIEDPAGPEEAETVAVTHTFTQPGDHRAVLAVWDDEGNSDSSEMVVHVNHPPVPAFTSTPAGPLSLDFDASSTGDEDGAVVRYSWDFGDQSGGEGKSVRHTFPRPGDYRVRLRVWDDIGASVDAATIVTLAANQPPVAALALEPPSGSAPLTVFLNTGGSHDPDGQIVRYLWSTDGGPEVISLPGSGMVTIFHEPGRHTVRLVVEDDQGLRSAPVEAVAQADAPPALSCEDYRAAHVWQAACNANTVPGYYWETGPEIKEYGWYGNVPSGIQPECNADTVGTTAMTYAWWQQPQWAEVNTVWCRNTPASDNWGCLQPDGPIFVCNLPHCGIYQVTCRRQG